MKSLRAWDDVAQKMLYATVEQFDDMLGYRFDGHFETDKPVYMWGTGLPDRNGKEIYEDDAVNVENGKYKGIVKFNEQDLSYVIEDKTGGYGFVNGQTYDERPEYRTYEVIGNRWDNPDLLEGEKI